MTIQQAIVKAYSEGWRHKAYPKMKPKTIKEDTAQAIWYSQGDGFLLDPLFWQSLGKAMGWTGKAFYEDGMTLKTWKREWHRFIDKLADGGTAEQFFEELK